MYVQGTFGINIVNNSFLSFWLFEMVKVNEAKFSNNSENLIILICEKREEKSKS